MQRLPAELLFSLCWDGQMQLALSATCKQFRQMLFIPICLNVNMDPITFRYRIQQGLIYQEEQTCIEITKFIQSIDLNTPNMSSTNNMVRALKSLGCSQINLLLERRFFNFFMHNAIQTNFFVKPQKRINLIK